jgi:hypothetical protein
MQALAGRPALLQALPAHLVANKWVLVIPCQGLAIYPAHPALSTERQGPSMLSIYAGGITSKRGLTGATDCSHDSLSSPLTRTWEWVTKSLHCPSIIELRQEAVRPLGASSPVIQSGRDAVLSKLGNLV